MSMPVVPPVMSSTLHIVFEVFVVIAVLIMIWGLVESARQIIFCRKDVCTQDAIKIFSKSILIGLQVLIVADVVETIIAPDLDSILRVFGIVVIRTIMAVSLNWELKNHH